MYESAYDSETSIKLATPLMATAAHQIQATDLTPVNLVATAAFLVSAAPCCCDAGVAYKGGSPYPN